MALDDEARIAALAERAPCNPFLTLAYLKAMRGQGAEPWVLAADDEQDAISPVLVYRGRLNTEVYVLSTPGGPAGSSFWPVLWAWLRRQRVTWLHLQSFAAEHDWPAEALLGTSGEPPAATARCGAREPRTEFVLDLQGAKMRDPTRRVAGYTSNHRRKLRRAMTAGLRVVRRADRHACETHAALMNRSAQRRSLRGDASARGARLDYRGEEIAGFVTEGAGCLYQALLDGDTALASVLVLRSSAGGYYQSAGASPEGLANGAPVMLVDAIAQALQADGSRRLNLGGATDAEPGLLRFKQGFGAATVPLCSVSCDLRASWQRVLERLLTRR
ncbi:MAG: GNAT family N-acetyltransferase [Gammaproteobacteria bacterium]|nr:GNAT family N-acetyltransferase [Gammaproteobacteria bacterium]